MKWIRWPGLIAFVIVIVVIAVVWVFLVDRIVHSRIERYGTDIVGAKVELGSADVSLFPLGLELIHLQVTDPEKPMTNIVEVGLIEFSLDALNLLKRKVIIDKMSIVDVELGTARETSGAVSKDKISKKDENKEKASATSSKSSEEGFVFPSLEIPDMDEILEKEDLETLVLVNSLEKEIENKKEEYKKRLKDLPGKEEFNEYEKRIKKLESTKGDIGGILTGVQEADKVIDDIEFDLKRIKNTKKQFGQDYEGLKNRVNEITKAPAKDIARLKEKYSFSSQGVGNMSRLILGPKIGGWVDKGLYWYEKMDSMIKKSEKSAGVEEEDIRPVRGKGVNVMFEEESPIPDLLIRKIETSLKLDLGDLWGTIENVTPDQETLGLPLTFDFAGEKLKSVRSINLDGVIDHTNPEAAVDKAEMKVYGYRIKQAVMSGQKELPITMEKGFLDMDVNAIFRNTVFDIDTDALFDSIKLNITSKDSSGKIIRAITDSLSDISSFTLKANVKGTLDEYETSISSNIDDLIKGAVKNLVKDQAATFEKEMKSAVNGKVNGPISGLKNNLNGLSSIDKDLTSREQDGNDLIKGLGKKEGSGGLKLPF